MTPTPTPMRRFRPLAAAAALAFIATAGTACAGASMDTSMGQRYAIEVVNEMPHAMIIALEDGEGRRVLGTVGADREERFILDPSGGTTVTIVARDEGDTHSVRRTVVLRPGSTVEVRIN